MRARAGEWFSLIWDITDFYDPISFEQHKNAPRFLYAEEDSTQIEGEVINQFDRLRLTSIFLTTVFLLEDGDLRLPTHYRVGEFMPNDKPKYDAWLAEYHNIIYSTSERIRHQEALLQKNLFLEHIAKVIRHDMHSGINTYIPRGVKSLIRRLPEQVASKHKLDGSIQLLEEGLAYTKQVYEGVYAFTQLMKSEGILEVEACDLAEILKDWLQTKAYKNQVTIDSLLTAEVSPILFCIAIDNLIRGGLQFNESEEKWVRIYVEGTSTLCVLDNGVGMSQADFFKYCKPYIANNDVDTYQGLDLNIAVAIIEDHGFTILPQKQGVGTLFRIELDKTKPYIIDNRTPQV
jgi:light-regulated signal transduction histidine kinase (bacteriophytochrome)